jgi:hypothetical protein
MQIPGYDFWKERAVQAKSLAERMRTPQARRQMLLIAEHYEMLADEAKKKRFQGNTKGDD